MYKKVFDLPMVAGAELPFELPEWIACAPFEEYLGMRIEDAAAGEAVLSMPFKVKLAQDKGVMHGGAVTALADTAVAMAIKSVARLTEMPPSRLKAAKRSACSRHSREVMIYPEAACPRRA